MVVFVSVVFGYLAVMNIYMYALMWKDKSSAERNEWRVKEKKLWLIAAAGGAVGGWVAMRMLRHKTKHPSFSIGLPALSIVYLGLLLFLEKTF